MPPKSSSSPNPASALSAIGKSLPKGMSPKKVTVKVKAKYAAPKASK